MINRVVIVGRLSRDPELRKTNNGTSVASITVAVDNIARDSEGNKTASFIPVTLWSQRADFIAQSDFRYAVNGFDFDYCSV